VAPNVLPQERLAFVVFTFVIAYVCRRWLPEIAGSITAEGTVVRLL
jgi:hypothetical protein